MLRRWYGALGQKLGVPIHWPRDLKTMEHLTRLAEWGVSADEVRAALDALGRKYTGEGQAQPKAAGERQMLRMQGRCFSPGYELVDKVLWHRRAGGRRSGAGERRAAK